MSEMKTNNYGSQLIKGLSGKLLATIIGFIGSIILARYLGPKGLGMFYLFFFIVSYSKQAMEGVLTACKRYYTHTEIDKNEIITLSIVIIVLLSTITTSIISIFQNQIQQFTGYTQPLIAPFFLAILSLGLLNIFQLFTTGEGKFGTTEVLNSLRSVFIVLFQVSLVLYFGSSIWMVYGIVIANTLILPFYYTQFSYSFAYPSKETISKVIHYSKYSVINGYIGKSFNRIDIFFLGMLTSSAVVGQYEIASRVTAPAMFVTTITTGGLAAYISNSESRGNIEQVESYIQDALRYTSILVFPLTIGAIYTAENVLRNVYGAGFKSAGKLLIGIAFLKIIKTQLNPLITIIDSTGNPRQNLRISILALLLIIPIGYYLLKTFGPIGIILGFIIVDIIRYVLSYMAVNENYTIKYPKQIAYQLSSAIIMGLLLYPLYITLNLKQGLYLAVFIFSGATIYFTTLFAIDTKFRQKLREEFKKYYS